jgi:hypothetical protein
MGNAQKPTPRTCHIDIKYFALCDWVELDLIHLECIDTSINTSDHLTKSLPRILFHRHANFLLDISLLNTRQYTNTQSLHTATN